MDEVQCWGRVPAQYHGVNGNRMRATERFVQLSAGAANVCGVRASDGAILCFGRDHSGQSSPPKGAFVQAACGWETCCGIRANASLVCWGSDWGRLQLVPPGRFVQVSVSESGSACGITMDNGDMVCWGTMTGGKGYHYRRPGPYVQVTTTARFTCGIRQDSRLDCFGETHRLLNGPDAPSPDTLFLEIASHDSTMCGITVDLQVICWGEKHGTFAVPTGLVPLI